MSKISRNHECLCGSGKKYKRCCLGKVEWERLIGRPFYEHIPFMSLRGRNIAFMAEVLDALQIDTWKPDLPYAAVKRAFTPKAVQRIYGSIPLLWPNFTEYSKCMAKESEVSSALYTGSYEPEDIYQALSRHSLYTEKIFITDPFSDPRRFQGEMNPLECPEQHRAEAIKWTMLWLRLYPWISADIVNIIRPPADLIPGLWNRIFKEQHEKFEKTPELKKLSEEETERAVSAMWSSTGGMMENIFLRNSDDYFRATYHEIPDPKPPLEDFLKYLQERRDKHPYFVEAAPGQNGEYLMQTTGACYSLAKMICQQTGSHLITNLPVRWKEIELDRPNLHQEMAIWSPFAKALQNAELSVLDSTSLEVALQLRTEGRLERMRLFFRKVWNSCKNPDDFGAVNSLNLDVELQERVSEARFEWDKIDQDLGKWFGLAGSAAVVAASSGFMPVAFGTAAVGGIASLVDAHLKRKSLKEKLPAAFFLGLKKPGSKRF